MAGPHVDEDDLTLLYYAELAEADARAAAAHLEGCPACRGRQTALARLLAMVDDTETPEPDAGFEAAMWRRLQPALRAARQPAQDGVLARFRSWLTAPPLASGPGRWALAGGLAALVLAAFAAGRLWPASPVGPVGPPLAATDTSEALRERVLLSALGDHFDRTEAMLVELAGTAAGDRVSISAEQRRAGDLLAATRLYRRAAVDAGDSNVAEVLEVLQRILVEVTGSPSELSAFELQALQHRIETQELLFKLRIASSAVRNREHRTRRPGREAITGA
ncbi:MAG: hypothetical protein ABIT71_06320 [Vicinamibacteraceae bacterium]